MPGKRPFEEKIKELLICSLCQDVFENPRQLFCGHSFCLACIRNLATSMQYDPFFKCPVCRFSFGPIMHTFITLALKNIVDYFNNVSEVCLHLSKLSWFIFTCWSYSGFLEVENYRGTDKALTLTMYKLTPQQSWIWIFTIEFKLDYTNSSGL